MIFTGLILKNVFIFLLAFGNSFEHVPYTTGLTGLPEACPVSADVPWNGSDPDASSPAEIVLTRQCPRHVSGTQAEVDLYFLLGIFSVTVKWKSHLFSRIRAAMFGSETVWPKHHRMKH